MLDLNPLISGSMHPLHFLLLEGGFVLLSIVVIASLATRKCLAWRTAAASEWQDSKTRIELDAAEKGDRTKSLKALSETTPPDLVRRAILHKRWMMIAHDSQFPKPGDYRSYTVASVPFFVIRDRDGKLRAFHNVCRHRAYAVVRKSCGNSLRLACKYHGWQYEANGRLVKAPHFLDGAVGGVGFDASQNGLFEIHLRVDSGRFVFVNLATQLLDAFPWSDTSTAALRVLDLSPGKGAEEWEMEIEVGWRMASLLPWFIDPAGFTPRAWHQRLLSVTHTPQWPCLQYIDDGSFICNFGTGRYLMISALPVDEGNKTLIKCTHIPPTTATSKGTKLPREPVAKSVEVRNLADVEIMSAIERLKKFRAVPTNLDLQQSAVRERWDKMMRHIDQHRCMEKLAKRKINPIVRTTGRDAMDAEAEAVCEALEGKMGAACAGEKTELEW